jgi:hypothetical protein
MSVKRRVPAKRRAAVKVLKEKGTDGTGKERKISVETLEHRKVTDQKDCPHIMQLQDLVLLFFKCVYISRLFTSIGYEFQLHDKLNGYKFWLQMTNCETSK